MYLGLFGDHIVPAVLYRYTQVLRRADLVNSKGKRPVTTVRLEAVWKRMADRFAISMPDFSPQNDTIFPGPQIAPVGISDPTFSSRSDLRYVPTLRTFLLYECFFYSEFP